jgi:23S rRNA (pseudouridine1915-N3)-methyltransferase
MQLTIGAVGKLKAGPDRDLYQRYAERVTPAGKALGLGPLNCIEISESRKGSARERCEEEARTLLSKTPDGSTLLVLDEKGKALTSEQFAQLLGKLRDEGASHLAFIIGGPDGHGGLMRERSTLTLSLGAITLPHGLARIVLAEQIYRAVTILAGHPYHRS